MRHISIKVRMTIWFTVVMVVISSLMLVLVMLMNRNQVTKPPAAQVVSVVTRNADRLERSFEAERQFTSDASHELRTPVAVILAECDSLDHGQPTEEDYRQSVDVIRRQGQQMSRLIGQLLHITRLEQGTQKLQLETADLSQLVEVLCEEQAHLAPEGTTLAVHTQPDLLVNGDVTRLSRLLTNLISNAYRYGKPNGHVWVDLRREGQWAVLSVRDAARGKDGSGLGLSMVQQAARLHGGSVTVDSRIGGGAPSSSVCRWQNKTKRRTPSGPGVCAYSDAFVYLPGKFRRQAGLFRVHEHRVIAPVPLGQHTQQPQTGVLAVTLHPGLPKVRALFHGIAAGGDQGHGLALPQGRPLLPAVILVHSVYQPVQDRLHGRGAVPGVDGRGQHQQVAGQHAVENLLHVVVLGAAEHRPILLAHPAGPAGPDLQVIQPDRPAGPAQLFQLRRKGRRQRGGVALLPGTGQQDTGLFHVP